MDDDFFLAGSAASADCPSADAAALALFLGFSAFVSAGASTATVSFFWASTFGFLADTFGRRRPYFGYLFIAAALVPIYGMTGSPTLLLLLGPLVAFFGTGSFSGYAAIASEIFPGEIRAAAMGLSYNIGRGFSAVAPLVVGSLAVKRGIGPAFLLQAGAFLVAALLSLLLPETRGRRLT